MLASARARQAYPTDSRDEENIESDDDMCEGWDGKSGFNEYKSCCWHFDGRRREISRSSSRLQHMSPVCAAVGLAVHQFAELL